jgi:hypothetical protein
VANIKDLVADVNSDEVYYEEAVKETLIEPGTYEADIVGLRRKLNTKTKAGYKCDIYWPRYKIAKDSPKFANRLVRDRGQFRFNSPEARSKNIYYKKFLDAARIPLEEKEKDGKIMYLLPSISADMIEGKKALINIYHEEWSDAKGYHKESVAKLLEIVDVEP